MILVLNCGSQSIKWKIFLPAQAGDEKLQTVNQGKRDVFDSENFEQHLKEELAKITEDILLVGHRVVHGGTKFVKPLEITEQNLSELSELNHLAPLHNPYNILGIKVCREIFKTAKHVAVFDTEFFVNLPDYAKTYALPEKVTQEMGIERFGFQGTSHEYVASQVKAKKIITCHLGGGASVCAIKDGKAIDISMGFTPLEGLVMATRSGSIDPGIIIEMVKKYGAEKTDEILNKESGLKGICGQDNMLEILKKMNQGDVKVKLAYDVFIYSIKKYIGAYFAILGGCDVLVFTGSIGSGDPLTREAVCKDLTILKKTKILSIETNEELAIAKKIL